MPFSPFLSEWCGSFMLIKIVSLVVACVLSTNAFADTLQARLDAAATRVASVQRGGGGSGAEVRLIGVDPVILRAGEGATDADMRWANHVRQAYELALAVGGSLVEQPMVTQSLHDVRSVAVEGAVPIAGRHPEQILARFFKALLRESETISLDLFVAVTDTPDDWAAVLKAIRDVSVSTPSLIAGTERQVSLPVVLEAGELVAAAHSPTPGISIDSLSFSGGQVSMRITADSAVPKGLHPVYFYTQDSKFEPAARVDLRVEPPLK